MLDALASPWRVQAAPMPPAARLIVGRPPEEALALVPRLFSLCREAQGAAMAAALGRPAPDPEPWRVEILRDHLIKICITLPERMDLPPAPLPAGWRDGGPELALALFGPTGRPPRPAELDAWLASGVGVGATLGSLARLFAPGEAAAEGLSPPRAAAALTVEASENTVAARHMDHPLMRAAEAAHGRGPLWRVLARVVEIDALLRGWTPAAERHGAIVTAPAARGTYALRVAVAGDRVTAFERVTPTDHLLAPGGVLDRCLAALPADRARVVPLLIDLLDPCIPVRVLGGYDA